MTLTATLSPLTATGGQDIGLFPLSSELTVAQAAKILDMTEACVNEFLDAGVIESRWDTVERWVQQDSLLAFDSRYRKRCATLAEITREWQELGIYDD